jgi:hypothetical protein
MSKRTVRLNEDPASDPLFPPAERCVHGPVLRAMSRVVRHPLYAGPDDLSQMRAVHAEEMDALRSQFG